VLLYLTRSKSSSLLVPPAPCSPNFLHSRLVLTQGPDNVGVGSIVYALAGEIPTSVLRQKTLAIAISASAVSNTFWSFVSPYIYNPGYGGLKAKIGFVFMACMIFFVVTAYLYVPETRRRTYEELDELFMDHVPARKFKQHVTVAEQRAEEAYELVEVKNGRADSV
jgi:MFS transporter, SP family, general alpha glucoside:H+ symporter